MPTLLRTHDSPVPTHTTFGSLGDTRIAPIDWQYLSNTGLNVVAPSFDTHTPPPAEPTHSVTRSPGTPSMQEMRPPMTPGPSERARRPSKVSESSAGASSARATAGASSSTASANGRSGRNGSRMVGITPGEAETVAARFPRGRRAAREP